jgi:hypothetical protein
MKNINMFATENDTKQFAVCIDGYFGLFDTEEEAKRVFKLIPNVDSAFFSRPKILKPGFVPIITKLSNHEAINIEAYLADLKANPHRPVYIFTSKQHVIEAAHAAGSKAKTYEGAYRYLTKRTNAIILLNIAG